MKLYRSLIDGLRLSVSQVCFCTLSLLTVHNDDFIVIDLSRLLLGFCPEAFSADGLKDRFADALFRAADWSASWALPLPKPRETNMLLLLRTLCNAFQEDGQTDPVWLTKVCFLSVIGNQNKLLSALFFLQTQKVLQTLAQAPYTALNKTQRVALATIVFNVSCQGLRFPLDASLRDQSVSLVGKVRIYSFDFLPRVCRCIPSFRSSSPKRRIQKPFTALSLRLVISSALLILHTVTYPD